MTPLPPTAAGQTRTTTPDGAIAAADLIAGMAKGMAVLESFDTERQRLNATLAAQRTGITRAAARRHLLTLAHLGYLETDGAYFWLSPKVLRFSGSYLASARLPRVLQPMLGRLSAVAQESFSAVVLDGDEVVIVARSGNELRQNLMGMDRLLAYGLHLGARLPAHATSTGQVLLAAKSQSELAAWLKNRSLARLTAQTLIDVRTLRQRIAQVGKDDFCLAVQEHELGVQALAVPLRNPQGRVVAALNMVAATSQRSPEFMLRDGLPLLQVAANELRAML
jgi:IclR family transcriptional regulator, pca regulon regulatory protein